MSKLTLSDLRLIVSKNELHDSRAVSSSVAERAEQATRVVRGFDRIADPNLQAALLQLIETLAAASPPRA